MAADSANIVLIDIFRLLVRSGVVAALLSTQTPAASDHSINHEGARPRRAADSTRPRRRGDRTSNPCASFAAVHESAYGTKRTCPSRRSMSAFEGKADIDGRVTPRPIRSSWTQSGRGQTKIPRRKNPQALGRRPVAPNGSDAKKKPRPFRAGLKIPTTR